MKKIGYIFPLFQLEIETPCQRKPERDEIVLFSSNKFLVGFIDRSKHKVLLQAHE